MFSQISFWIGLIIGWVTAFGTILLIAIIVATISFRAQRKVPDAAAMQRLLELARQQEADKRAGQGS